MNVENQSSEPKTRSAITEEREIPWNEQIQKYGEIRIRKNPQDSLVVLSINLLGTVGVLMNFSFYDHVRLKCSSSTIGFRTSCNAL